MSMREGQKTVRTLNIREKMKINEERMKISKEKLKITHDYKLLRKYCKILAYRGAASHIFQLYHPLPNFL